MSTSEPKQCDDFYPTRLDVDFAAGRSRLTTLFRLPLAVPRLIVTLLLLLGVTPGVWATVLVTGRIPGWMLDFERRAWRWHASTTAYTLVLTDVAPVLEEGGSPDHLVAQVVLEAPRQVARRKVLVWKLVTALPHLIVLTLLTIALIPVTAMTWVTILTTGRAPHTLHRFAVGVLRWWARVGAYIQSLTDCYPPFSLRDSVGPARPATATVASTIGLVPACLLAAVATYVIGFTGTHVTRTLAYAHLADATAPSNQTIAQVESGRMQLALLADPADSSLSLIPAAPGSRFVAFSIDIQTNFAGQQVDLEPGAFQVDDTAGHTHEASIVSVNGVIGRDSISNRHAVATVVFQIPSDRLPQRLTWDVVNYIDVPRRGETIVWAFE